MSVSTTAVNCAEVTNEFFMPLAMTRRTRLIGSVILRVAAELDLLGPCGRAVGHTGRGRWWGRDPGAGGLRLLGLLQACGRLTLRRLLLRTLLDGVLRIGACDAAARSGALDLAGLVPPSRSSLRTSGGGQHALTATGVAACRRAR